jgi:hypothetical protein
MMPDFILKIETSRPADAKSLELAGVLEPAGRPRNWQGGPPALAVRNDVFWK